MAFDEHMVYCSSYQSNNQLYMSDEQHTPQPRQNSLGIPIAIVLAAALIAGAIYMSNGKSSVPAQGIKIPTAEELAQQPQQEIVVAPVTEDDHIRGNPNAPIVIVEYSDFDCPFCKNFHDTMARIMDEYGPTGKVAWVYRQFPLQQLHPNAPKIAVASECVAELGGDNAFWKFADLVFGERGTNEPTNINRIAEFAETSGVSKDEFELCYSSGKYDEKIATAVSDAIKAGAQGTPYSILIAGDQQGPINGAQPYAVVKQMIDTVIAQLGG
jgi:protein-disulfide isomerase